MLKFRIPVVLVCLTLSIAAQGVAVLTPVQDATIYEPGNVTSNGAANMIVGLTANCSERRALVKFDPSSIPAGAVIQDVELSLFVLGGSIAPISPNAMDVSVAPVLQAWGEGTTVPANLGQGALPQPGDATWIHAMFPSVTWTNPGGDFGPESATVWISTAGPGSVSSYRAPQLISDVQNWIANPASNHGYMLRLKSTTTCQFTRVLGPRESATPSTLTVYYTMGGGPVASTVREGFVYPGTTSDRGIVAVNSPTLGNPAFLMEFTAFNPPPTLFASIPGPTAYQSSLDIYTFLDLGMVPVFIANGFGPFPGTNDPVTGFPQWSFAIPGDPILEGFVVSFQSYGFGPFGGFEASNAVTVRVGN